MEACGVEEADRVSWALGAEFLSELLVLSTASALRRTSSFGPSLTTTDDIAGAGAASREVVDADNSVPSIDRRGIFIGRPSYASDLGELGLVGLELGRLTPIGACTCNTGPSVLLLLGRPAPCFARSRTRFIFNRQYL